jgi:hypothetical protein
MRIRAREEPTDGSAESQQDERLRAELDAQREAFDRELVRRAFRISELEEALKEQRRTYEDSLSWRITMPLRAAKARLTRRR